LIVKVEVVGSFYYENFLFNWRFKTIVPDILMP